MLLRVKNIDIQAHNRKGFNVLQHACLKGNANAVEKILARDAGQVDKMLDGKYTALHIAATNDHVDCVTLLIKNGNATVSLQGHNKLTPLHMACIKGHVRSLEALVENGNADDTLRQEKKKGGGERGGG
ncbi:E3 ubiquitin-protein ligase MIB2-like, partial [Littorina saxatilis]|uniref:E3 ubiquitin-protein ligase MIB2-like n=1 Tax=Littorina saxatilis TaxID=31220 RepID=UPI0038B52BEB